MGHVGAARRTVYCASKHAMEGFTKAMAIELAPHDIRVQHDRADFIETPLTKRSSRTRRSNRKCCSRSSSAASADGRAHRCDRVSGERRLKADDRLRLVVDGGWTAE